MLNIVTAATKNPAKIFQLVFTLEVPFAGL